MEEFLPAHISLVGAIRGHTDAVRALFMPDSWKPVHGLGGFDELHNLDSTAATCYQAWRTVAATTSPTRCGCAGAIQNIISLLRIISNPRKHAESVLMADRTC